jgi:rod shape-determining protein MreD
LLRVIILFLIACLLGIFVQSTMIHATMPSAAAPDIIVVLVVIIALQYRNISGVVGAFALGLLSDFASGQFVGPNAAAGVVVFGLVGAIASRVYADRSLAFMFIVFVCSLAKSATVGAMYLIYLSQYTNQIAQFSTLKVVVVEAVLTSLIAPVVLRLLVLGKPFPRAFHPARSAAYGGRG